MPFLLLDKKHELGKCVGLGFKLQLEKENN